MGYINESILMLEAAYNKIQNEEIAKMYFFCLLKENKYDKQKEVALKLYSITKSTKYAYWITQSLIMRSYDENNTKPLDLAEAMMNKIIGSPNFKMN